MRRLLAPALLHSIPAPQSASARKKGSLVIRPSLCLPFPSFSAPIQISQPNHPPIQIAALSQHTTPSLRPFRIPISNQTVSTCSLTAHHCKTKVTFVLPLLFAPCIENKCLPGHNTFGLDFLASFVVKRPPSNPRSLIQHSRAARIHHISRASVISPIYQRAKHQNCGKTNSSHNSSTTRLDRVIELLFRHIDITGYRLRASITLFDALSLAIAFAIALYPIADSFNHRNFPFVAARLLKPIRTSSH